MNKRMVNASAEDLRNGYVIGERAIDGARLYSCLFCSVQFDEEDVYTFGKLNVSAKKAIRLHIQKEHGDVFTQLVGLDKAVTGLTDTQRKFLELYYDEMSDDEIAQEMGNTPSTVRFQRYSFREKAKQAKFVMALAGLLEERERNPRKAVEVVDEHAKALLSVFESLTPLVLKTYNMKKKKTEKRTLILNTIIEQFEVGREYTEKQVNAILTGIYPEDYVTIRRELIDFGLMDRTGNCSAYWRVRK